MNYSTKYKKYKRTYLLTKYNIDIENMQFTTNNNADNYYFEKYMKYKFKYNKLKTDGISMQNGGNINFKGISKKFTKTEYDKLDEKEKSGFPFYCDDNNPNLCSINTLNYGLCKKKPKDCTKYNGENNYLEYDLTDDERKKNFEYGKNYNYSLYDQHNKDCSKIEENLKKEYSGDEFKIKNKFRIMTYNCWWNFKKTGDAEKDEFNDEFFMERMDAISDIIKDSDADIICLQEVGKNTFDILKNKLKNYYKYYYEEPFNPDENNNGDRKRTIETFCVTRYPIRSFKSFGVNGNLCYNNSMLMIEYDNLIVFNVYLQAGTKNSPGQRDLWFNYSRCRYNEYLSIGKYMKDNKIEKPVVVLGDFNTNLNGDTQEWPELRAFNKLKLKDAWLEINDNSGGFTENTKVNFMRWNVKFEEKMFRIDGIFHSKKKIKTRKIEIVGDEPIDISKKLQDGFYKHKIPNKENKDELIRKNDGKIQFWPSDHFGVVADLEIV